MSLIFWMEKSEKSGSDHNFAKIKKAAGALLSGFYFLATAEGCSAPIAAPPASAVSGGL